jgi:hypothetical protein
VASPTLHRYRLPLIAALAAAAAVLAYATTLRFGFVYDDQWSILQNPHLQGGLGPMLSASWQGRAVALSIPDATRPLMIASIWLDHRLFGESPLGYHAHSLALHALNAALAALAAFSLTRKRSVSLLAAAWFALAPLQAEAVASINYREDLLATAGQLAVIALLFRPGGHVRNGWAELGVVAAWLLALFAKESALGLALLLPVLGLVIGKPRWFAQREYALVMLAAAGLFWLSWRFGLRFGGDDVPLAPRSTAWTRVVDTARFEVRAALHALFPFVARPEHSREGHASAWWLLSLVPLLAATVASARRPRLRAVAVGLSIALIAPLMTSPLVGPVNPRADRFLYLSVFGGALCWAALATRLLEARRLPSWVPALALAIVCTPLAWRAASPWASERSLWQRAIVTAPNSPRAWAALARVERREGNLGEADRLVMRALELDPDYVPAHVTRLYNALAAGNSKLAASELATIERLGGGLQPAVRRARRCAALPTTEAASACISEGSTPPLAR